MGICMENNMDMDTEKIIGKIKKILELSKNNPSEEEAKAAALKAQRMMMQYHIAMEQLEAASSTLEEIIECCYRTGNGKNYKIGLAQVVANNFRCRTFMYNSDTIVFYGYKTDAEIAKNTFKMLFEVGEKRAISFYNKKRKEEVQEYGYFNGKGVKAAYMIGYVDGIKFELEKQSTALMIVVPEEVRDAYVNRTDGCEKVYKTVKTSRTYYDESYSNGFVDGKNMANANRLK